MNIKKAYSLGLFLFIKYPKKTQKVYDNRSDNTKYLPKISFQIEVFLIVFNKLISNSWLNSIQKHITNDIKVTIFGLKSVVNKKV